MKSVLMLVACLFFATPAFESRDDAAPAESIQLTLESTVIGGAFFALPDGDGDRPGCGPELTEDPAVCNLYSWIDCQVPQTGFNFCNLCFGMPWCCCGNTPAVVE